MEDRGSPSSIFDLRLVPEVPHAGENHRNTISPLLKFIIDPKAPTWQGGLGWLRLFC
jgi:hypothetical protein